MLLQYETKSHNHFILVRDEDENEQNEIIFGFLNSLPFCS